MTSGESADTGHNGRVPRRSKPEKYRPSWFWLLGAVIVPFIRGAAGLRLKGVENVPERGAFVLSPNHYSEIDPVIVAVALWRIGRAPRFLAKASLWKIPVLGAALKATGQIPVERAGVTRSSVPLDAAEALTREGQAVIVYPEGSLTRDPDMWPMRGKSGAVRLALEQGIPLIPAAHWGTQGLMPRYAKGIRLFPRAKITVLFGEPVDLDRFRGRPMNPEMLAEATDVVMQRITGLLEQLRGETAPPERWDPKIKGQTETGRF
jgi:1-acyl-sn-glycerol-3-phosphate acyltransferase